MAIKASDNFKRYHNPNGPDITPVKRPVFEVDGLYFKDIDGTGTQRTDYSYQFSKSLFDNRLKVVIGGSYASNQDVTQNLSENLIDDISLEYRLDKRENMYLKVFRQTGYESIIEGEITQTGIGFMYRKQINSLLDFFRKKPQHKKPQATKEASDTTVNIIYTPINNITPTEITTDKEEP